MSEMGDTIRLRRQEFGWSLEKLANLVGSTKSYIWELENKPNIRPSAMLLYGIAVALETTTEELLGIDDSPLTIESQVFLRKFRRLGPKNRRILMKLAEIL